MTKNNLSLVEQSTEKQAAVTTTNLCYSIKSPT